MRVQRQKSTYARDEHPERNEDAREKVDSHGFTTGTANSRASIDDLEVPTASTQCLKNWRHNLNEAVSLRDIRDVLSNVSERIETARQ